MRKAGGRGRSGSGSAEAEALSDARERQEQERRRLAVTWTGPGSGAEGPVDIVLSPEDWACIGALDSQAQTKTSTNNKTSTKPRADQSLFARYRHS